VGRGSDGEGQEAMGQMSERWGGIGGYGWGAGVMEKYYGRLVRRESDGEGQGATGRARE